MAAPSEQPVTLKKTARRIPSRKTMRRLWPLVWRQRWTLALTVTLMGSYSVCLQFRNLTSGLFFDWILVGDTGGITSAIKEKVSPAIGKLGLKGSRTAEPVQIRGQFEDLRIASCKYKTKKNGNWLFEDGIADRFTIVSGDEKEFSFQNQNLRFSSLEVRDLPANLDLAAGEGPISIPGGSLRLEYKQGRVDTSKLDLVKFLIAFGLLVCIGITLSDFGQKYLEQHVIQRVLADLRDDLIDHLSKLSLSFYHRQARGDLMSRVSSDTNKVGASLQLIFGDLFQFPIVFLISTATLFYIHPGLAAVIVLAFPWLFLLMIKSGKRVRKSSRKQSAKRGLMTTAIEQLFSGIRTVKSFSMEAHERKHFSDKNREVVKQTLKTNRAKIFAGSAIEFTSNLAIILVVGVGGYMIIRGWVKISIGELSWFVATVNTMYNPVKGMARAYTTMQESFGTLERVMEIFEIQPTVREEPDAKPLPPFQRSVRYEGVWFSYGREPVLRDVSFEIPAGSLTAIVGPTGAGKSTLVDLLLRFYDPTKGRILIDGADIRGVTISSLLSQIAIVSQEPFLFDTTIANNIRYGRSGSTQADIEAAARAANIHDFIASLPDGYETEIGDRGVMLSGGQRQRITIARSLLKDAPILILDEATSNLDAESEAAVQDALEKLIRVRSTIAIAHRLSTIRNADNIIVLEKGAIAETGTYDQLIAKKGLFHRLYSRQFRAYQDDDGSGAGHAAGSAAAPGEGPRPEPGQQSDRLPASAGDPAAR